MPEPADADHDGGCARHEQRQRTLDRVVRRERGVTERRGIDRIEFTERNEKACRRYEQVLRHAAVDAEARAATVKFARVLAVVLGREAAGPARAAAPRSV